MSLSGAGVSQAKLTTNTSATTAPKVTTNTPQVSTASSTTKSSSSDTPMDALTKSMKEQQAAQAALLNQMPSTDTAAQQAAQQPQMDPSMMMAMMSAMKPMQDAMGKMAGAGGGEAQGKTNDALSRITNEFRDMKKDFGNKITELAKKDEKPRSKVDPEQEMKDLQRSLEGSDIELTIPPVA